jgi:Protein of unknown function (DUF5661)
MKKKRKISDAKHFLNRNVLSIPQLAKKHGVEEATLYRQLLKGIKVELEHTTHKVIARRIALGHLKEDPKYYTKLAKMENK